MNKYTWIYDFALDWQMNPNAHDFLVEEFRETSPVSFEEFKRVAQNMNEWQESMNQLEPRRTSAP